MKGNAFQNQVMNENSAVIVTPAAQGTFHEKLILVTDTLIFYSFSSIYYYKSRTSTGLQNLQY
jgi:hypothetical protein